MSTATPPLPPPDKKRALKPAQVPLPFLVEFTYTLARLTVLFAGVITLTVSLLAHATPWIAVFRSSLAMIVTGLLAWMLVSIVGQNALEVAKAENAAQDEAEKKAESTVEKEA